MQLSEVDFAVSLRPFHHKIAHLPDSTGNVNLWISHSHKNQDSSESTNTL